MQADLDRTGRGAAPSEVGSLSVVVPSYNAATWLPRMLVPLREALHRSGWEDVEIVVVDDGSTDGTAEVIAQDTGDPPVRLVQQENRGRFPAREAGLRAATGDYVLLIDSRVFAHPDSLRFIHDQLREHPERRVWNGHAETAAEGNPFARFWDAVTFLAWRRYRANPRTLTYGPDEYDWYPKGTAFLLAPRTWLLEACEAFDSQYDDLKRANDDPLLIKPLAARCGISISPSFSCTYHPRDSLRSFVSHSFHRGTVFVDGYYRPGSRFHRPLQVLMALAPIAAIATVRRPRAAVTITVLGATELGAGARAMGVPGRDAASFGALSPLFAVSYGAGIAQGMLMCRRRRS